MLKLAVIVTILEDSFISVQFKHFNLPAFRFERVSISEVKLVVALVAVVLAITVYSRKLIKISTKSAGDRLIHREYGDTQALGMLLLVVLVTTVAEYRADKP